MAKWGRSPRYNLSIYLSLINQRDEIDYGEHPPILSFFDGISGIHTMRPGVSQGIPFSHSP